MKKKLVLPTTLLLLAVFFIGCGEEPSDDIGIGEITITNIPAQIFVWDPDTGAASTSVSNPTFKVYINASDSMEPSDPPKAKGLAYISDGVQTGSTYSVSIPLQYPNPGFNQPGYNPNPNLETGPWHGTARYFSIMISPEDITPHGINAIWAKGVNNLDRGKETISWTARTHVNFRGQTSQAMKAREEALFNDIIMNDTELTRE